MSCNYADGLSPYDNKGVLGTPEKFETKESIEEKCTLLAKWIKESRYVVVHTGAGISTSAGIPDFRGPNGVWTLEKQGKKPDFNVSFGDAIPTKTHMALLKLINDQHVHYIISQNIDGLHLRSGVQRDNIAELHGNMFTEQCNYCDSQYVRHTPAPTVGKKCLDTNCKRVTRDRPCRGKLFDTILDWEDSLPDKDLEMADYYSSIADLNICLGTTLQIVPSGKLPLKNKKHGGKLVIVNLQPTKHDKKADLIINTYVDDVMESVIKELGIVIPTYSENLDPSKEKNILTSWDISNSAMRRAKTLYDTYCKNTKKRKLES